jgi:DNA-binding MarR family transcriptional regulator
VKRSAYRRKALIYLYETGEPRTPTEIGKKIDVSMNHVSRGLREMADRSLVEVINPEAAYDRRYRITDRGRRIIDKIREIEEE